MRHGGHMRHGISMVRHHFVHEHGIEVGSAMPPFEAVSKETEIWRIIAHLRSAERAAAHSRREPT
jgi:hypothetical protein